MRKRRVIFGLVVALPGFMTTLQTAYAHETWFVRKGEHAGEYFSMDPMNLLVILGATLLALSAFALHRTSWIRNIDGLFERGERWVPRKIQWRIVAILSGITFIANSITGVFLAPDFVLPSDGLVVLGSVIQMAIGLLLASQISFSLAGALIVVAAIPLAAIYSPGSFLTDHIVHNLALALAFVFVGLSARYPGKLAHLPVPTIRVSLGLTLILLSIHHKLIDPDIALTFRDKYELNFMPHVSFTGFTNLHFVFAAGVAELTLGLLLFAGIATRLVSAGLVAFLPHHADRPRAGRAGRPSAADRNRPLAGLPGLGVVHVPAVPPKLKLRDLNAAPIRKVSEDFAQ